MFKQRIFNIHFLRLHLVLIKSKLDQLKYAQPLKPFLDAMGNIQSKEKNNISMRFQSKNSDFRFNSRKKNVTERIN
jgi:hypothetical protein